MAEFTDRNPPAFPRDHRHNGHNGMSLRDWFAGQALTGSFVGATDAAVSELAKGDVELAGRLRAQYCYKCADAMLAERIVVRT